MRRPPDLKKPHFFTFVCPVPPSSNGSVIPESFIHKYLKGERIESASALLRRGGRIWAMKITSVKKNGTTARIFAKGWDKFEKDNGLELGDFIVFRHEGHLVFEVLVFDRTMCERQVPSSSYLNHGTKEVDLAREEKKSPPEANTSEEPTPDTHGKFQYLKKIPKGKLKHPPYYVSTLRPCNLRSSVLNIPKRFAKSNGLWNRHCEMILRDEKRRSWRVQLRCNSSNVCSLKGWRNFCITNGLKEGDEFMLELIENGDKPIMNFSQLNKTPKGKEAILSAEAKANLAELKHPHFVSTLRPHSTQRRSLLYIPLKFARSNGLRTRQCEIILRDENHRSWKVNLKYNSARVWIGDGWRDFRIKNGLKDGDTFMLELIENGDKPIMNFRRLNLENRLFGTRVTAEAPTFVTGNDLQFAGTLKPYSFKRYQLWLPRKFARSNGLTSGDMILQNGSQKTWPVELKSKGIDVYIANGLKEFLVANDLNEGDGFKFQLIENVEKPIAKLTKE